MTAPARRHGSKRYVTRQAERHAFDHNGNISIGGLQ